VSETTGSLAFRVKQDAARAPWFPR